MLTLITCLKYRIVLPCFSTIKLLFSAFHTVPFGRKSLCNPLLKGMILYSTFDILPSLCFFSFLFFLAFPYFLELQDTLGTSSIIPSPVLGSDISLTSLGSIYWRMVLETKHWALGVLIAAGVLLLLGLLYWQSKEMHVCRLTPMYIHIYKHTLCNHLLYIKLNMNSYWYLQISSVTTWVILASSPYLSVRFPR